MAPTQHAAAAAAPARPVSNLAHAGQAARCSPLRLPGAYWQYLLQLCNGNEKASHVSHIPLVYWQLHLFLLSWSIPSSDWQCLTSFPLFAVTRQRLLQMLGTSGLMAGMFPLQRQGQMQSHMKSSSPWLRRSQWLSSLHTPRSALCCVQR